jgi:hypothetical protein
MSRKEEFRSFAELQAWASKRGLARKPPSRPRPKAVKPKKPRKGAQPS